MNEVNGANKRDKSDWVLAIQTKSVLFFEHLLRKGMSLTLGLGSFPAADQALMNIKLKELEELNQEMHRNRALRREEEVYDDWPE